MTRYLDAPWHSTIKATVYIARYFPVIVALDPPMHPFAYMHPDFPMSRRNTCRLCHTSNDRTLWKLAHMFVLTSVTGDKLHVTRSLIFIAPTPALIQGLDLARHNPSQLPHSTIKSTLVTHLSLPRLTILTLNYTMPFIRSFTTGSCVHDIRK
jgi:hypothetical protein